jgi:hypothetical protein
MARRWTTATGSDAHPLTTDLGDFGGTRQEAYAVVVECDQHGR